MSHRSEHSYTDGCKVNRAKLTADLTGTDADYMIECLKEADWDIGKAMDDHKLKGYWPDDKVRYLYACLDAIEGLSDYPTENRIFMKYEGHDSNEPDDEFQIRFYRENEEPRVELRHLPSNAWETVTLERPGT